MIEAMAFCHRFFLSVKKRKPRVNADGYTINMGFNISLFYMSIIIYQYKHFNI